MTIEYWPDELWPKPPRIESNKAPEGAFSYA